MSPKDDVHLATYYWLVFPSRIYRPSARVVISASCGIYRARGSKPGDELSWFEGEVTSDPCLMQKVYGENAPCQTSFFKVHGVHAETDAFVVTSSASRFGPDYGLASLTKEDGGWAGTKYLLSSELQTLPRREGVNPICLLSRAIAATNAQERMPDLAALVEYCVQQRFPIAHLEINTRPPQDTWPIRERASKTL